MIPRTLVPTDVRPFTDKVTRSRLAGSTTYMDDRTVVPSDLSDAPPLTGKTNIPEHLPLGVLVERTLVARGIGVKPFEQFLPPSEYVPLAILDPRVVVPAYVEPPEQREIDKFDQPPQMTARAARNCRARHFQYRRSQPSGRAGRSQRRQVGRHHPRHFRRARTLRSSFS